MEFITIAPICRNDIFNKRVLLVVREAFYSKYRRGGSDLEKFGFFRGGQTGFHGLFCPNQDRIVVSSEYVI